MAQGLSGSSKPIIASTGLQQETIADSCSSNIQTIRDPTAPHSTRVRAADSVLDHSAKAIEIEDVEARVAELERAAAATRNGS